jgi:hypothetical protein
MMKLALICKKKTGLTQESGKDAGPAFPLLQSYPLALHFPFKNCHGDVAAVPTITTQVQPVEEIPCVSE